MSNKGPNGASGWEIMIGLSNSCITNGMYPSSNGPESEGGNGSMSADIEVFLPDLTPNAEGEIEKADEVVGTEDVGVEDPFTKTKLKKKVKIVKTVRCQYLGGQNILVPCVHVGEQVWVLYHAGGPVSYYWLPMGRDNAIRLREHIRWFAMNQPKSITDGKTPVIRDGNTYFIDINTQKDEKAIQIHTSMSDGEEYGYDIRIVTDRKGVDGKYYLEITDTNGNFIHLDTREHIWRMENNDKSYIEINKNNITLECKDTITLKAGNHIEIFAEKTMHTKTVTSIVEAVTTHKGDYTEDGAMTVTGLTTVNVDTITAGKSFNCHIHRSGGTPTTRPVA